MPARCLERRGSGAASSTWTRSSPATRSGWSWPRSSSALRPFGMGNPGVNLLVPAARISDVRPMGEGRHARFTVTLGGRAHARRRVRRRGARDSAATAARRRPPPRPRRPAGGQRVAGRGRAAPGAALAAPGEPAGDAASRRGCAGCACRARAARLVGRACRRSSSAPLEPRRAAVPLGSGSRTVVDRRGEGALGALCELLTTRRVAARRVRRLLAAPRAVRARARAARFGRGRRRRALEALRRRGVAARARRARADALRAGRPRRARARPVSLERFTHVFAARPAAVRAMQSRSARRRRRRERPARAFLHLGWGAAEVEFAAQACSSRSYALRGPLASLYRALRRSRRASPARRSSGARGDGRHPRTPGLAGALPAGAGGARAGRGRALKRYR